MKIGKRAIVIVLDSVGVGECFDSCNYGDQGSNTLANTALAVGGLDLPHLQQMGLGNIIPIKGVPPLELPQAAYGKMTEKSPGKDTTTGHWELMGLVLKHAFPTYPEGFPPKIISEFEQRISRKTLGNIVASGTEIIKELGQEHMRTGYPIVYTSADSVFQIAAHEKIIPLEQLYAYCRLARDILQGEHAVGRVIARPFIGEPGNFVRTANRHDFSLKPDRTILDNIKESGQVVIGIGKINDIFAGQGITESHPVINNQDGVNKILKILKRDFNGLLFVNLVDFDQLYGHRNDVSGYAHALEEFDQGIPKILALLKDDDLLIITADHGCDPTTASTDHSREYVPVLVYGNKINQGINLGCRETFADVAATIAEFLGISPYKLAGKSFLSCLIR
ncbi:MAG: phosphopentomutase [Syntrophomonadaceae bacterium]|jgi:phosphopentomutase